VPAGLVRRIDEAEKLTAANERMTLFIAFNYGARQEILDAAAALAREWVEGGGAAAAPSTIAPSTTPSSPSTAPSSPSTAPSSTSAAPVFTADDLRRRLYAPEMHDPELLVRTSGEQRISNFLLWQLAYSELYFSDKLWPDFAEEDLDAALAEYARRQRRFGGRA